MATNISDVLMHKSKFFDSLLNDLQTDQKRLKKIGILRVSKKNSILEKANISLDRESNKTL